MPLRVSVGDKTMRITQIFNAPGRDEFQEENPKSLGSDSQNNLGFSDQIETPRPARCSQVISAEGLKDRDIAFTRTSWYSLSRRHPLIMQGATELRATLRSLVRSRRRMRLFFDREMKEQSEKEM